MSAFAGLGDILECDLREPYPHTHRLTLLTPEATAYANELLARENTPWRLVKGGAGTDGPVNAGQGAKP